MSTHPLQEFPYLSLVKLPAFLASDPEDRTRMRISKRQIFFQAISAEQYMSMRDDIRLSISFGRLEDRGEIDTVAGTINGYNTFETEEEAEEACENQEIFVGHWVVGWDGLSRPLFTNEDMEELRRRQVMTSRHCFPPFYEKMCSILMDYLNGRLSETEWRVENYETITPEKSGGLCVNAPVPLTGFELGKLSLAIENPFQLPLWKEHVALQL